LESQLIDQIRDVLTLDTIDEYQLVYVLTKIRKLIELKQLGNNYPFLRFYCNWALHPKLDQVSTTNIVWDYIKPDSTPSKSAKFDRFEKFFDELDCFCGQECTATFNKKLTNRIIVILQRTFMDSPLVVTRKEEWTYTLKRDEGSDIYYYHLEPPQRS